MCSIGRPRLYATNATRQRAYRHRKRQARQTVLKVYHRHKTSEYATPQDLFEEYHAQFGFTLDVAAQPDNTKCARYSTPEDDGLSQAWGQEICWLNPPYGPTMGQWMRKAYESAQAGATVVCLVPVGPAGGKLRQDPARVSRE
jgi:hypothetical protein